MGEVVSPKVWPRDRLGWREGEKGRKSRKKESRKVYEEGRRREGRCL